MMRDVVTLQSVRGLFPVHVLAEQSVRTVRGSMSRPVLCPLCLTPGSRSSTRATRACEGLYKYS